MSKIILLRGPSGVGKSTIAKELILHIKNKLKLNCAYISEDDFRKQMQFKYKAADKITHTQSVNLIKAVITELTKIDNYDIIVVEGLFRYPETIEEYKKFCKTNKFKLFIFQLFASLEVRKERNKISNTRDHVSNLDLEHGKGNGEEVAPKDAFIIDTTKTIEQSIAGITARIA